MPNLLRRCFRQSRHKSIAIEINDKRLLCPHQAQCRLKVSEKLQIVLNEIPCSVDNVATTYTSPEILMYLISTFYVVCTYLSQPVVS